MDAAEYANLEKVEREHWYYAGKRELAGWWLRRVAGLRRETVLADCGAGTGRFALELAGECQVRVVDDHGESLAILRQRFSAEQVLEGSCTRLPFAGGSVDCLTALDVLEHVEHDAAAVREFQRVLRPGGVAVVTVPAAMALWSDWDVALHHFRRYARPGLVALFPAEQWELVHVNYTNVVVFPAVWVVRKWRHWTGAAPLPAAAGPAFVRAARPAQARRAEDALPPRWLNRVLQFMFVRTGRVSAVPFPFGVSLLLVARKKG
ncbi:MAG: class I SAM-dependent methyltransferase [Opitutae bacterium]|nr:class I SAM-dependent methyltransferase [Opitutae bacterium]